MQIVNILPNNYIDSNMVRQDIELYLAHQILKEPERFRFLSKDYLNYTNKYYKILDNSAFELKEGLSLDKIIEASKIIGANEIVLPDIYKSSNSFETTLNALYEYKKSRFSYGLKLAAVAQGSNMEELKDCINQILSLKEINTIMLPKWSTFCNEENGPLNGRRILTKYIIEQSKKYNINKEIHWLGLGIGISELFFPEMHYIRSVDTGYFTMQSTTDYNQLKITTPRPESLEINLDNANVDSLVLNKIIKEQKEFLKQGGLNVYGL